jgi:hypothetical protein
VLAGTTMKMTIQDRDAGLDVAADGVKRAVVSTATAGLMKGDVMEGITEAIGEAGGELVAKGGEKVAKLLDKIGIEGKAFSDLASDPAFQKVLQKGFETGGEEFIETLIKHKQGDPKAIGDALLSGLNGFASGSIGSKLDESLKAALDPNKFPPRLMTSFVEKAKDLGIEKAFEAMKGETEGTEQEKALEALKTAMGFVKTAAKSAKQPEKGEKHEDAKSTEGDKHEAAESQKKRAEHEHTANAA